MIANRSPAGPTFIGSTTLSTAAVATAASIALPPFFRMSSPACAASGWLVATIPLRAITSERRCRGQPSDRSPDTALHHAGAGAALQDCTGDWAPTTAAALARTAMTRSARNRSSCFTKLTRYPPDRRRCGGHGAPVRLMY